MSTEAVVINPVERMTGLLANLVISNELVDRVKLAQMEDGELNEILDKTPDIVADSNSVIRFRGRLWVPNDDALRRDMISLRRLILRGSQYTLVLQKCTRT